MTQLVSSRARPSSAPDSKSCAFSPVPWPASTGHRHVSRVPLHCGGVGTISPGSPALGITELPDVWAWPPQTSVSRRGSVQDRGAPCWWTSYPLFPAPSPSPPLIVFNVSLLFFCIFLVAQVVVSMTMFSLVFSKMKTIRIM